MKSIKLKMFALMLIAITVGSLGYADSSTTAAPTPSVLDGVWELE